MYSLELHSVHAYWYRHQALLGYDETRAVSLKAPVGRWIALVGENGIGKSTLLHAIAGTANFVIGQVVVNGSPLMKRDPKSRFKAGVCSVFQRESLEGDLSTDDCVDLSMLRRIGLYNESAINDLFEHLAEQRLIQERRLAPRMFDLVCCILCVPQVLILDEILPAWPVDHSAQAYNLIRQLLPYTTVLFTDHNITRALAATDHVLWLSRGDIPKYFSTRDDDLSQKLVESLSEDTISDPDTERETEDLWHMVKLDRSARSQVRLALQSKGVSKRRLLSVEEALYKDFSFLSNEMPAEVLSGGQRIVLLWALLELGDVGKLPNNLIGHLDKENRRKIDHWSRELKQKLHA
jgi:ABC-type branched-subunit amino acid transport system ATPase component